MFIIRQEDLIYEDIPVKYRGRKGKSNKVWGDLEEDIKKVIPFQSTQESVDTINTLIRTMYKKSLETGENLTNLDKFITILDVDEEFNIRKVYPLSSWFNPKFNKLEW